MNMRDITHHIKALEGMFEIDRKLIRLALTAEEALADIFRITDVTADFNQHRVLKHMQTNRLSETHFASSTGYGYNDAGREVLERIFAGVMGTEAALVRPQMISGSHAIATALFGALRPGDELLSVTGAPYDTLRKIIGITPAKGSLMEHGIVYKEAALNGMEADYEAIKSLITPKTKVAAIQRSKGYSWRKSLSVTEINGFISFIKAINQDIICFVDNCYGEFVEEEEPKADLMAGSLIKNPGGGLAPCGGYVVGRADLVEAAACRLNVPGAGLDMGPTLGLTGTFLQGLFMAPQIVAGALKGAMFAGWMAHALGYDVLPGLHESRSDIVQAIKLRSPEAVAAFCKGVQMAAPVDSFVTPEPWDMPGYGCPVIMAAGTFVQGSSIELSADAPMRPPYTVFFQGGLSYAHSRLGALMGLNEVCKISD